MAHPAAAPLPPASAFQRRRQMRPVGVAALVLLGLWLLVGTLAPLNAGAADASDSLALVQARTAGLSDTVALFQAISGGAFAPPSR